MFPILSCSYHWPWDQFGPRRHKRDFVQVDPLGWEDPLEKGKATHSGILAWRIPWTVEFKGVAKSQT